MSISVPLWLQVLRISTLVTLAIQMGLILRFVLSHPRMPKSTIIPLAAATGAFYWEQVEHWSTRYLEWHASPLALVYSISIIAILLPYMRVGRPKDYPTSRD